jgi:hypothetical protein
MRREHQDGVSMIVTFGEKQGQTTAALMLTDPTFVRDVLAVPDPDPSLSEVQRDFRRKIDQFDAKPFVTPCSGGDNCPDVARIATMALVLRPALGILGVWCKECRIEAGATEIRTYQDVMDYVTSMPRDPDDPNDSWMLVESLLEAKGFRAPDTESVASFFGEP